MPKPKPLGFWLALGSKLTRIPLRWKKILGPDHDWAQPFLRPTGKRSLSYPCSKPHASGCHRRIVEHSPDSIVAVCDSEEPECDRMEITVEDIVEHELDLLRVGKSLATALGLSGKVTTVGKPPRVVELGFFAGVLESMPVTLLLPNRWHPLHKLLISRSGPGLVLTPTGRLVDHESLELIQRSGLRHSTLEKLLEPGEAGTFTTRTEWMSLVAPSKQSSRYPVDTFQRQGNYWRIVFQGEEILMSHSKGLGYLLVLLREPGREFSPHDLRLANGEETGLAEFLNDSVNEQALEKARNRLIELEVEIELAEAEYDLSTLERRKDEEAMILQQLQEQLAPRREDPHKRVRDQVSKAIKRSLETLGRQHPSLGRHLVSSMHFGGTVTYRPNDAPEWQL